MVTTLLALLFGVVQGDAQCTLLHFTAAWCQPCQQLQPAIDQLSGSGWDVRPVDTDRQPQLAQQFNIRNLPTLVIVSEGREVDRIVGLASHNEIEKRLLRAAARSHSSPTRGGAAQATPGQTHPGQNSLASETRGSAAATGHTEAPIVRGQSPGLAASSLSAIPQMVAGTRAVAGTLANTATAGGLAATGREAAGGAAAVESQLSLDDAVARAARATVRIRVDEGNTLAYGTGSIVDVRGDEALVLTCGHLFREMQAGTQLTVDLFAGTSQEINVPAELIDFTADGDVDIGLISMRIPVMIEPVRILPRDERLQVNQPVFSFGCDHGQNPTRRDTRISRINRYTGAANVEIIGAPAVGRSGGGLFDERGRLIGVCNAANANENEGIYAAADVIYTQLERLNLTALFEQTPPNRDAGATPAQLAAANLSELNAGAAPTLQPSAGSPARATAETAEWPDQTAGGVPADPGSAAAAEAQTDGTAQVICILRDAQGRDRLITIHSPSDDLLERIRLDAQQ